MYNRRYEKVFLMLRQEMAGYGMGNRLPWGSCVMELKNGAGRIQLRVQGLRPQKQGYGVYVLVGEESIFCGTLYPDSSEGHGELKWDFDPDAIGTGRQAEELQTVLVVAGTEGDAVPLTGYFGEKQEWRQTFSPCRQEEIRLQAAEAALCEAPVLPLETEPQEVFHAKTAEVQKTSYHGSFQGLLAKFRQELEELEGAGILTQEETAAICGEQKEPVETTAPKEKEETEEKEEPQEKISLFADTPILEPFRDGVEWRCLSLEELTLLSQVPLRWQQEFFFLLPYRRYHHLILREETAGIWLGLPSSYAVEEEKEAEQFGFREFRRVEEDWGYWMAFLPLEG